MQDASRHPGGSTCSCPCGSISTILPENSPAGWRRQPRPCSPCRAWCHCDADGFATGLSRPPGEGFHQHLSCLFSHFPPSSLSSHHGKKCTQAQPPRDKPKCQPDSAPACHIWEDRKAKSKDVARKGRRNIQLTSALAPALPSVLPSMDITF
ncbi:hypothetical protein HJG60_008377 [Phyllostomus discolor]|uniref:Uncharacterized protein n=1 Tax=Phyllostomus discolor TaxID=89673 RepID=A0A834DN19_9CHIR|nr:hypothetical protein HJG60_008377 [Phyllostomus discolor]